VREGQDQDGDGYFNEDGPGGVVIDQNFPLAWPGASRGARAGPLPLSEPEALALARLGLSRKLAACLVFQGNHGHLAIPGAAVLGRAARELPLDADRPAYERAQSLWSHASGRPREGMLHLWEARGDSASLRSDLGGSACDWMYAACGALSLEIAPWGPQVERSSAPAGPSRAEVDPNAALLSKERAWTRWLDDKRGGIGFVDWHPVERGKGQHGGVGGWAPQTVDNPPPESLPEALKGMAVLARELAAGLPQLSIDVRAAERNGTLVRVLARVRNAGLFPSSLGPLGGLVLSLALPEDGRLLGGEARVALPPLAGGSYSETVEWWVLCPQGAPLRLAAEDRCALPVERELRP
jgi:hypothetical protein